MATFEIDPPAEAPILKVEDADRLGFIRKVYSILSFQLLLTSIIVAYALYDEGFQIALLTNTWLIVFSFIGLITTLCTLLCVPRLSHKVPTNYCLLGAFTIFESILVATTCVQYDPMSVFLAAVMACAATLALTAYACTTKEDFSVAVGVMLVILVSGLFFIILMPFFIGTKPLQIVFSCLFVLVYGIYIIIDTQLIAGGGRYKLTTDDYILGSLYLYVDIIGLFLHILRLLGERRG